MFWDNFERLCNERGLTPTAAGISAGVTNAAVSKWKNGTIPRGESLKKVAEYFNVSVSQLLGEDLPPPADDSLQTLDNIFPITRKAFPLLGDIACGEPIYADENRESYIMAGTEINADFCLRAKGDSMIGARILDGDIVFIKKMPIVDNGSIAAVIIDDEATLKRVYYYPNENRLRLFAENPAYKTIEINGEELNKIRILGKAVAFQSDVL